MGGLTKEFGREEDHCRDICVVSCPPLLVTQMIKSEVTQATTKLMTARALAWRPSDG
jgi:hypothetical protein